MSTTQKRVDKTLLFQKKRCHFCSIYLIFSIFILLIGITMALSWTIIFAFIGICLVGIPAFVLVTHLLAKSKSQN